MRAALAAGLAIVGMVSIAAAQDSTTANATASATPKSASMTHVKAGKFAFSYRVDGRNLVASISYPTTGWVAVGFDPTDQMKDANIIIGYAGADGKAVVEDHFGVSPTKHTADTAIGGKDDIVARACVEKDGVTTMRFTIPLDSGDSKDRPLKVGSTVKVIFAAGKGKNWSKHTDTGRATISL